MHLVGYRQRQHGGYALAHTIYVRKRIAGFTMFLALLGILAVSPIHDTVTVPYQWYGYFPILSTTRNLALPCSIRS
jgi:hypothetical protein